MTDLVKLLGDVIAAQERLTAAVVSLTRYNDLDACHHHLIEAMIAIHTVEVATRGDSLQLPSNEGAYSPKERPPNRWGGPHEHDWRVAELTDALTYTDFWICVECAAVRPGPCDNPHLDPRRAKP